MQPPHVLRVPGPPLVIEAAPLTREAFAPFGDVIENPRPHVHPSSVGGNSNTPSLPFDAVPANQGSAIKYQHVSRPVNLYDQAPSGRPGSAIMSVFVCAARARVMMMMPDPAAPTSAPGAGQPPPSPPPPSSDVTIKVSILERHPFTTQTFIPLPANPAAHYLVIVAPTLPSSDPTTIAGGDEAAAALPVPTRLPPSAAAASYPRPLPGGGLPDVRRLRAFVATARQAVTYGAGTWHAPMVALGEAGTAVDFVVAQFANGVGVEDCQEVVLALDSSSSSSTGHDGGAVWVKLKLKPGSLVVAGSRRTEMAKL
ncbi:ureidoglycolate hydrolase [Chaetomium strumarium]|uniref:Ureidoglycolate hydrolase n=1 Tax=Chaetomium strumarium TaxID=1170767 RepID=A0AAJ0M1D5_9PEZI|nr:ureidoglycolate hydrolase [Chaetomium strumarium]